MSERIKAVLFDVAGVLSVSYTHLMVERGIELGLNLERMAEVLLPIFAGAADTDSIGHQLERGEVSLDEFFASLGDLETDARAVLDPDSEHFFGHGLEPEPLMSAFVDELRVAGLRTGVISNTVREWHPAWERAIPPRDHFETVVFSADVGVRKPNAKIYLLALERMNLDPGEAVFLDDFAPMAQGARAAGLHAVEVKNHDDAIDEVRGLLGLSSNGR